MGNDIIQARYEALDTVAQRFAQQAEAQRQMERAVAQALAPLQAGGWIGRGVQAFLGEMRGEVTPSLARLTAALQEAQRVTMQMSQALRAAEEEAARLFQVAAGGAGAISPGVGADGGDLTGGAGGGTPPPRVYIVNGINSPAGLNPNSVALRELLARNGFDPRNILITPSVFMKPRGGTNLTGTALTGTHLGGWLSPVDWLTGKAAAGINTVTGTGADIANATTRSLVENIATSTVVGGAQVVGEYVLGSYGPQTRETYAYIQNDLRNNPLLPGQSVVLVGHSGGGAIVTNMAGMIERNLGYNVSGVVTAGSPLADYSAAAPYAEHMIEMSHPKDLVHHLGARVGSLEKWESVLWSGRPVTELSTAAPLEGPFWGWIFEAHGSYMRDDAAAGQLRDIFVTN